jgi:hypothetical protein
MPIVYVVMMFLPKLIESTSKIKISPGFKAIVVAVTGYWLFKYFSDREAATKAEGTALGDPAGNLAVRLFDALHPIFKQKTPLLGYLPDGTNETEALKIAAEIRAAGNLAKVQDYYKKLYAVSLADDLASEGIADKFSDVLSGRTPGPGTASTSAAKVSAVSVKNTKGLSIEKGKRYLVGGSYYLRDSSNTSKIEGMSEAGEVYHINYLVNYTLNGQRVTGANVSKVVLGVSLGVLSSKIVSLDAFSKLA